MIGARGLKYGLAGILAAIIVAVIIFCLALFWLRVRWHFEPQLVQDFHFQEIDETVRPREREITLTEKFDGRPVSHLQDEALRAGFKCRVAAGRIACEKEADDLMCYEKWSLTAEISGDGVVNETKAGKRLICL